MPFKECPVPRRAQTFNGKAQGVAFGCDVPLLGSDVVTNMWVERPVPVTPSWVQGGGGGAMESAGTD